METRKQKLISGLKTAINALEKDTVLYNWENQDSCNCGVVAQACLGKSKQEIKTALNENGVLTALMDSYSKTKDPNHNTTWKNVVKQTCSITGKSTHKIFIDLAEAGLTNEDICHLEYLENPAILKKSGISTKPFKATKSKKTGTKTVVIKKGFLGIGRETKEEDVYTQETGNYNYWTKKENLILYLRAWVAILNDEAKEVTNKSTKEELSAELLKCVADENYEQATKLRDMLTSI